MAGFALGGSFQQPVGSLRFNPWNRGIFAGKFDANLVLSRISQQIDDYLMSSWWSVLPGLTPIWPRPSTMWAVVTLVTVSLTSP